MFLIMWGIILPPWKVKIVWSMLQNPCTPHLMLRLGMSELHLHPPCAFMACTGTVLSLLLYCGTVLQRLQLKVLVICMCSHPDQLWSSLSLLFSGHKGLFPSRWSGLGMKLASQPATPHLMLRLSIKFSLLLRMWYIGKNCPLRS
jgi:hypothetical protein